MPVIGCTCEVCRSLDYRDKRLRVSVHIEVEGQSLVIDSGPDFRQQMLRERIGRLDALLFTHEHKDHTAGLDDIRGFNFHVNGMEIKSLEEAKVIPIYARQQVLDQLKREFAYIFDEHKFMGLPQLDPHAISNLPFEINGLSVIPIEAMHYRLPVFGYRIKDFTYITDANFIAPAEMEKIKGSRVVVINALQKQNHASHFNLEQALAVIAELKPEQAFLTHLSHKMGLHSETEEQLPPHVRIAYDGLKLKL